MSRAISQQAGFALITLMGVVIVISSLMTAMLVSQRGVSMRLRQDELALHTRYIAHGAEEWMIATMQRKMPAPMGMAPFAYPFAGEGVTVQMKVENFESRLNINDLNINNFHSLERFEEALKNIPDSEMILGALGDWLDPDDLLTEYGHEAVFADTEIEFYQMKGLAYSPSNGALHDISELRMVPGVTQESYDKLRSVVCVLPPSTSKPLVVDMNGALPLAPHLGIRTMIIMGGTFSRVYSTILEQKQDSASNPGGHAAKNLSKRLRWAEGEGLF